MKFSSSSFGVILVSVATGLFMGWLHVGFLYEVANVMATIFTKLLQLIAPVLLFFSVISSFLSMEGMKEFRLIGRKLFTYTLLTTLLAATSACLLYSWIFPEPTSTEIVTRSAQSSGFFSHLLQSVPDNFLSPFIEGNVFSVALLALALGFASLFVSPKTRDILKNGSTSILEWLITFTKGILLFLPLAMWAFSFLLLYKWGDSHISSKIFLYVLLIFAANFIQGVIILPLFLRWKGISPWKTFVRSIPALSTAFFTKSSNAALPVTLECAQKRLGIRPKIANFSLPLCSVINMNGCAAFILITLFFVTGHYGISFSWIEKIAWIAIATFAAIGNAGVPMGCYFLSSALILSFELPTEIMGLILPFYLILDMFETSLNVWSDICVTSSVQKELSDITFEEELAS